MKTRGKRILRISDATRTPGGRYMVHGKLSGEWYRIEYLEKAYCEAVRDGLALVVDLDGTKGYATSFLDEAFGGLARAFGIAEVLSTIEFISKARPELPGEVRGYIEEANK